MQNAILCVDVTKKTPLADAYLTHSQPYPTDVLCRLPTTVSRDVIDME